MSCLRAFFAPSGLSIQTTLFPWVEEELGALTEKQQQLVPTLEIIRVEDHLPRAFAAFAATEFPQHVHDALVRKTCTDRLLGHLSRDSTAIEAREQPTTQRKAPEPPKRKRGRPKKGAERPKQLTRLQRQGTMTKQAMLDDLPTDCAGGTKKNSTGYTETWIGYKLHIDVADRAVSTSLRQPGSAFTVATPRHRRGATTTDRAAVAAGQRPHAASRPGCRSSVLGHPGGSFSTAD